MIPGRKSARVLARPLSRTQRRILCLAFEGLSNKQIADELGVCEQVVKNHRSAAYLKLGARNGLDALRRFFVREHGQLLRAA